MPRFEVSSLFGDHAVLARGKELRVFGTAEAGVRVTASLTDAAGRELGRDEAPERDGRFLCLLPPQEAQTGCILTLMADGETKSFADIAIGEVFLAGGQSNMELELQNADEGGACIAAHRNPLVRYYNVPKRAVGGEEADRANRAARWIPILPGAGQDMSAVAYFFAMALQRELGVPVGIIDCYWGGTSVTCWMDEQTLDRLTEGRRYQQEYRQKAAGVSMAQYLEAEAAFQRDMDEWNGRVQRLKAENPAITGPEITRLAGPCPWNPPVGPGSPYRPGGLHAAMLRRVIPCALSGVLFYQGEEDACRTDQYDVLLTALIAMLRRQFDDVALPFLNVQLPMWIADGAPDSFAWARLRLCQQRVRDSVRNTGLCILADQGAYDELHPTQKRVVGERLKEEAVRLLDPGRPYQQAPQAVRKYSVGGEMHVLFSAPVIRQGEGETLLEIAGEDGAFYPAQVRLLPGEAVLTHPQVPRPVAVRYAFTDFAKVSLFGLNGWPLAPFLLM